MNMNRKIAVFLLLTVLFCVPVLSLTLQKTSLEDLTRGSQMIVHARVVSSRCVWENQIPGNINTLITVDILSTIKGDQMGALVIRQMGGRIGDFEDIVPGTPYLNQGDEVVLFLVNYRGSWEIHSIALGVYRTDTDENGNKILYNDYSNVRLIDPVTRKQVHPGEVENVFEFNDFMNRLQACLSPR